MKKPIGLVHDDRLLFINTLDNEIGDEDPFLYAEFQLYDMQTGSVEVLAGPSTTLHGSGALGGVVQVVPQQFRDSSAALGYDAIVVAGPPEYYQRLGFSPASNWGITTNLPVPADAVSAMELRDGSLDGGGEVEYPAMYSRLY